MNFFLTVVFTSLIVGSVAYLAGWFFGYEEGSRYERQHKVEPLERDLKSIRKAAKPFSDLMDKTDCVPKNYRPLDTTALRDILPNNSITVGDVRNLVKEVDDWTF